MSLVFHMFYRVCPGIWNRITTLISDEVSLNS